MIEQFSLKLYKEDIGDRVSNRRYHRPGVSLEAAGRSDGIVYTGCFFHLFGWGDHVKVATRVERLLKPRKGSLLLWREVGNVKASECHHTINAKGTMWRHDVASSTRMWRMVGLATGTRWDVNATLDELAGLGGLT